MTIRERCVPCLEFKSDDDAWYDVSIELEDNKIKIHYEGFSDDCDEELALEDFKNVDEFKAKFRLSSRQLQDKYCRKVMQGATVCASCTADEEDTRFFDARVEKVCWSKHLLVDGEEQCMCTYELLWLAGPNVGKQTVVHCEDICLLQFGSIQCHPVAKDVLRTLQEKMDRVTQFGGRNSSKEKFANLEGSYREPGDPHPDHVTGGKDLWCTGSRPETNVEGKQEELEQTASQVAKICNSKSRTVEELNDGRTKAEWTKKSCSDDDILLNASVYDKTGITEQGGDRGSNIGDESLYPNVDYSFDSGRSSSPLKEMQKENMEKCNYEVNMTENNLCSEEDFLQEPAAINNESELNILHQADRDSNLYLAKQENRETEIVTCESEGPAVDRASLRVESYLPSSIKDVKEEVLFKTGSDSEVPIVDGTISIGCDREDFEGNGMSFTRKEERVVLPDLNIIPINLQLIQQVTPGVAGIAKDVTQGKVADIHVLAEPCLLSGERKTEGYSGKGSCSKFGKKVNMDNKNLGKQYSPVRIPSSTTLSSGGWIDEESCDMGNGFNAETVCKSDVDFACNSVCLTLSGNRNNINEWKGLPENHSMNLNDGIQRCSSLLFIENENGDIMYSSENASKDVATLKNRKIQEITQNDGTMKVCTTSSRGRRRRSKCISDEVFASENHAQNCWQNIECRETLDGYKYPRKDSLGAPRSDFLKTTYLKSHKRKEHLLPDLCDCQDAILRKVGNTGNDVHVCMPTSKWGKQAKQTRGNKTQLLECFLESSRNNEPEHAIEKNSSVHKQEHERKRSCRLHTTDDVWLQRSISATVETDGILLDNVQWEAMEGNICKERGDILPNHTSKYTACNDSPSMPSQHTHHSASNCHTKVFPSSHYSNDFGKASWESSFRGIDGCHYNSSFKMNRSSCLCKSDSKSSELQAKAMTFQCHDHVEIGCYNYFNMDGSSLKERNCTRPRHDHCAECAVCACVNYQTGMYTCAYHLDSDAYCNNGGLDVNVYCNNGQLKCGGSCSVPCKECAVCSFDCLGDGNDCSVLLKGESTNHGERNELCQTGNCNILTRQSLESGKQLNLLGKTVIIEEIKYNSIQQEEVYLNPECGHSIKEDLTVEGTNFPSSQVLLLENLEKDVSPSDILGVIHRATSCLAQVYISPSHKFERFTRAFACFEDQATFQKASAFLQNENIFIASSSGRPWVVLDVQNRLCEGSFGGYSAESKVMQPSCGKTPSKKIQIFHKGTPEYEQAKIFKERFLELREHLILLHKRLEHEESRV
eukprot:Gb_37456 [translate_table: standard]